MTFDGGIAIVDIIGEGMAVRFADDREECLPLPEGFEFDDVCRDQLAELLAGARRRRNRSSDGGRCGASRSDCPWSGRQMILADPVIDPGDPIRTNEWTAQIPARLAHVKPIAAGPVSVWRVARD
jgi:hypothetical protein